MRGLRVTLSLYLVPAAAIGISAIWLGQLPGPIELADGGVALAGVIVAGRREPGPVRPRNQRPERPDRMSAVTAGQPGR